jgi:hypothetical protein
VSRLETELRSTLASVQRLLDDGDVVAAGKALDDAVHACAQADGVRLLFTDQGTLLELVRACTVAAKTAERSLREQLAASSSAQQASRAYGV